MQYIMPESESELASASESAGPADLEALRGAVVGGVRLDIEAFRPVAELGVAERAPWDDGVPIAGAPSSEGPSFNFFGRGFFEFAAFALAVEVVEEFLGAGLFFEGAGSGLGEGAGGDARGETTEAVGTRSLGAALGGRRRVLYSFWASFMARWVASSRSGLSIF